MWDRYLHPTNKATNTTPHLSMNNIRRPFHHHTTLGQLQQMINLPLIVQQHRVDQEGFTLLNRHMVQYKRLQLPRLSSDITDHTGVASSQLVKKLYFVWLGSNTYFNVALIMPISTYYYRSHDPRGWYCTFQVTRMIEGFLELLDLSRDFLGYSKQSEDLW